MQDAERAASKDDPRLDVFRDLKARNVVRDARLFVAEGTTVVERVLQSELTVDRVLICDRKWDRFHERLPEGTPVLRIADDLAEELVGFSFHAGVVASVVRPAVPSLEKITAAEGPLLLLAGDRVTDPENVGALIRIAAAFGAAAVILGPGCADPFSRRVLRVSMGNVLFLPVVETSDLAATLEQLAEWANVDCCATLLDPTATSLQEFRFPVRTLLLFGNEYDGISASARNCCRDALTIPMLNGTDSLNIAVSAGIFSYQYRCEHPVVVKGAGHI